MGLARLQAASLLRSRWVLVITIICTHTLAVAAGLGAAVGGAAMSALAIALLGGVLAAHTSARMGPRAAPLLGGRAQQARRRFRVLLLVSVGLVYLVLVGGVLVTNAGALWACPTLVCAPRGGLALLAMIHRGTAAVALALVALAVLRTWRLFPQRSLRQAGGIVLGLMLVQTLVGLLQVWFLGDDPALLETARVGHLTLGVGAWAALVVLATLALRLPFPRGQGSGVRGQGSGVRGQASEDSDLRSSDRPSSIADRPSSLLKDYISLTKPGVITLLIFTTIAAMFITPAGLPSASLVFWTFLAGWLMPAGAHALNCYFDRDIDLQMGRTGRRPLPSNRIPAWHAAALGIALAALSFTIFVVFVNWAAALLALAGFFFYVVIYTLWLKRSTMSNIVIGGGAGAFPPLIGWAAVTGGLTLPSLFLFIIIFYWTPPHFWALALIRQKDYANAGVPMLPVVAGDDETKRQILLYSAMMVVLSLLLTPFGMLGLPYLAMALLLGLWFLRAAWRLYALGTTAAAWGLYKFSLLYLFLLFLAMVVDRMLVR